MHAVLGPYRARRSSVQRRGAPRQIERFREIFPDRGLAGQVRGGSRSKVWLLIPLDGRHGLRGRLGGCVESSLDVYGADRADRLVVGGMGIVEGVERVHAAASPWTRSIGGSRVQCRTFPGASSSSGSVQGRKRICRRSRPSRIQVKIDTAALPSLWVAVRA